MIYRSPMINRDRGIWPGFLWKLHRSRWKSRVLRGCVRRATTRFSGLLSAAAGRELSTTNLTLMSTEPGLISKLEVGESRLPNSCGRQKVSQTHLTRSSAVPITPPSHSKLEPELDLDLVFGCTYLASLGRIGWAVSQSLCHGLDLPRRPACLLAKDIEAAVGIANTWAECCPRPLTESDRRPGSVCGRKNELSSEG
ncbi:hypothetical protein KCU95_g98, partial [Aureobasidium melanogenum]